ncbi:MAG: FHIPEP family type III secretion protein [bacterium]
MQNIENFKLEFINMSTLIFDKNYETENKTLILEQLDYYINLFLNNNKTETLSEELKTSLYFIRESIYLIFEDFLILEIENKYTLKFLNKIKETIFYEAKNILNGTNNIKTAQANFEIYSFKEAFTFLTNEFDVDFARGLINPNKLYERLGVDILRIEISHNLIPLITDEAIDFLTLIKTLREHLASEYGYIAPNVRIMDNGTFDENTFKISIRRRSVFKSCAYPNRLMVYAKQWNAKNMEIPEDTIIDIDPYYNETIYWLNPEEISKNYDGIMLLPQDYMLEIFENMLFKYSPLIINLVQAKKYIEIAKSQEFYDQMITELIPEVLTLVDFHKILINLIKEKVSITDILLIFEKLLEISYKTKNPDKISEELRKEFSWFICNQYANNKRIKYLKLSQEDTEKLLNKDETLIKFLKKQVIDHLIINNQNLIILTSSEDRLKIYRILAKKINDIGVLAVDEIDEEYILTK